MGKNLPLKFFLITSKLDPLRMLVRVLIEKNFI